MRAKEKEDSMEIHVKMKSVASIPANYVSILQLQERWVKEKERKHKENDIVERGLMKHKVDGQRRREDVMKLGETMEPRVKLEESGGFLRRCEVNRWKKGTKLR